MRSTTILLVEDNTMDEELTLRAVKMSAVIADIVIARDGAAALDYLFATGAYVGRDTSALPTIVLLDLHLRSSVAWRSSGGSGMTSARSCCRSSS